MGKILEKLTEKLKGTKSKLGKKSQLIIAGILTIIMLIIFLNGILGSDKSEEKVSSAIQKESTETSDYVTGLENRLENILTSLSVVDGVEVFIMTETSTKTIYATDEKKDEDLSDGGTNSISSSVEIVFSKEGSSSMPIVAVEIYPEIVGVLVVAQAENDEKTRLMILNAVSIALSVENSKIEVLLTTAK